MLAEVILGGMLQQFPRNGSGDGGDRQEPEEHALFSLLLGSEVRIGRTGLRKADNFSSQRGADDLKPRAAKIKEHGEQSSEVEGNVKAQLVCRGQFVPAEQSPHNDEMPGTRNGNKFPESLNDGKNYSLENWQD